MSNNVQATKNSPPVIVTGGPLSSPVGDSMSWLRLIPASIISLTLHAIILALFILVTVTGQAQTVNLDKEIINTQIEEDARQLDLTQVDIGIDPDIPLHYDVTRIEKASVPGEVNPTQSVGILDAPPGPLTNIPPPPGTGFGQGGGADSSIFGKGPMAGFTGGAGGFKLIPGGFGGRSGSTRMQMALSGGGSRESEAAVGRALEWLAKHQSEDGSWSMNGFHKCAHELSPKPGQKRMTYFTCDCSGPAGHENVIAGTAFGLLPFLAAGQTHMQSGEKGGQRDFAKNVNDALRFLGSKQTKDGAFTVPGMPGHHHMYAHGLAAIAMCEAYGMTSDPQLKIWAQKGLDYIIYAQNEQTGGWRYTPKQPGDTSVVGWQVMALKSGQMSGLAVPTPTLKGSEKWLDSVMDRDDYGYGYTTGKSTPTMTAVGLLCRQYLGWSPRKQELINGLEGLHKLPPGRVNSMYYYYYATQVMHHMGGDAWESWNNGSKGKQGMRDWLISKQCKEGTGHRFGSWDPQGDAHGAAGGRVMQTALCVLTLEVYYRHLPLYRRDLGGNKELEQ